MQKPRIGWSAKNAEGNLPLSISMQSSALSRLQPDELCIVVLHDGSQRECTWSPDNQKFIFADGSGFVLACDAYEWWPASVRF